MAQGNGRRGNGIPIGGQGFSSSDPRISSVSIHMTLIMPNAQARSTPNIQEKYHMVRVPYH